MLRHPSGQAWPGAIAASALLAVIACEPGQIGSIGSSPGNSGGPRAPGGGPLGGPGATGAGGATIAEQAAKCVDTPLSPGPSFIRRLNRFEYNNTVRDLLGDTSNPADQFPSEEKRLGFDNNATALQVSPALVEQYMNAAEALAATAVTNKLSSVVPCDTTTGDPCAVQFIADFGKKAYRRPLTTDEATSLKAVFDVGAKTDFGSGVRLVLETVLQSAPFLYRVEFGAPPANGETIVRLTSFEMASRLSYLVWQSMPDDQLFAAADADALATSDKVAAQVDRMLKDPKAHDVFAQFHSEWLQLDKQQSFDKDPAIFPAFTPDLGPAMAEETRRFLDYTVWQGEGTLDALLTSPISFVNGPLAAYYGVSGPTGTAFSQVTLDATTRGGILTRAGMMAMLGKANQTAPVQRGKFVREQFLCNMLPPPPANIMIKAPELSPTLSTRERFAAHRTQALCNDCHQLMDPIGLGFENYDGAGHYRTTENGAPIDASGQVLKSDITGTFNGAAELAHQLAGSDQVRECVAKSWFRYAYGRAETTDDTCTLARVNGKFADAKYDLKSLIVALSESDAFLYRKVIPAGGAQ